VQRSKPRGVDAEQSHLGVLNAVLEER